MVEGHSSFLSQYSNSGLCDAKTQDLKYYTLPFLFVGFCLRDAIFLDLLAPFGIYVPEVCNMLTFSWLSHHCEMGCSLSTQKR